MSEPIGNPFAVPFPQSMLILSRTEHDRLPLTVEGTLPGDLQGHAFVIGPAGSLTNAPIPGTPLLRPTEDGTPIFNGDAMIYRLDFDAAATESRVYLTNHLAKTPCYYTDQATLPGQLQQHLGYNNHGLARLSVFCGFRNEVNTALIPMQFSEDDGTRLIITWDAGRPYEIDPYTLQIATPVGRNDEWQEQINIDLPFGIVTTTAHAFFDPYAPDGATLFTLNYGKSIPTAVEPFLNQDLGLSWSDLKTLIEAIEQRLTLIKVPLETLIQLDKALLNEWPLIQPFQDAWDAIAKPTIKQILQDMHHLAAEIDPFLPWSNVPLPYHDFVRNFASLLEEEFDAGAEDLLTLVKDILDLIPILKKLVDAAEEMTDFVDLIQWDGQGDLQKWRVLVETAKGPQPISIRQSMHQIAVTQDYVVLMDTVFKLGAEQLLTSPLPQHPKIEQLLRDVLDFRESTDTIIYIVRRADLTAANSQVTAKQATIPRGAAHFLADYDNPNHKITLHLAHNTAWDPSEWTRPYDDFLGQDPPLYGMSVAGMDVNHIGRYVVDGETGELCESVLLTDFEHTWMTAIYAFDGLQPPRQFKNIYWNSWGCWQDLLTKYIQESYTDYRYREVPVEQVQDITKRGIPVNLCRVDTEKMQVADSYQFPPGCFGYSAQFMPRKRSGSEAEGSVNNAIDPSMDGYIVCVVNTSDRPTQTDFWIFDAANLQQGPVCKLVHPEVKLGLTIHSTWLPEIKPRSATYNVPVRADYQNRLQHNLMQDIHPTAVADVQQLFEKFVYPNFEAKFLK
ncbi:MAG: carotenoid oxygenase family protein [Thainema sp.]